MKFSDKVFQLRVDIRFVNKYMKVILMFHNVITIDMLHMSSFMVSHLTSILSFQLSALEILAENLSGEISGKEEDFGRAGTVRAEFNQDMEEVQLWLQT